MKEEVLRRFSRFSGLLHFIIGLLPPVALIQGWFPQSITGAALVVSSMYLVFRTWIQIWRKSGMPEISYLTAAVNLWLANLLCCFVYDFHWREVALGWSAYLILCLIGVRLSRIQFPDLRPESKAFFALWLAVITDGAFFHPRVFVIGCAGLLLWMLKNGFLFCRFAHLKGR